MVIMHVTASQRKRFAFHVDSQVIKDQNVQAEKKDQEEWTWIAFHVDNQVIEQWTVQWIQVLRHATNVENLVTLQEIAMKVSINVFRVENLGIKALNVLKKEIIMGDMETISNIIIIIKLQILNLAEMGICQGIVSIVEELVIGQRSVHKKWIDQIEMVGEEEDIIMEEVVGMIQGITIMEDMQIIKEGTIIKGLG